MEEKLQEEHEITLRVTVGMEKLEHILNKNGYKKVEDFEIDDIYLVPEEFSDINKYDEIRLLDMSVRIRSLILNPYSLSNKEIRKEIVRKEKTFNDDNNILSEFKYVCRIKEIDEAHMLLKSLGYVKLLELKQNAKTYSNGNYDIVVSEIDGKIYLEMENKDKDNNILFKTTEEMIGLIDKYNIPHSDGEYFVQKAVDKIREMRNL